MWAMLAVTATPFVEYVGIYPVNAQGVSEWVASVDFTYTLEVILSSYSTIVVLRKQD